MAWVSAEGVRNREKRRARGVQPREPKKVPPIAVLGRVSHRHREVIGTGTQKQKESGQKRGRKGHVDGAEGRCTVGVLHPFRKFPEPLPVPGDTLAHLNTKMPFHLFQALRKTREFQ